MSDGVLEWKRSTDLYSGEITLDMIPESSEEMDWGGTESVKKNEDRSEGGRVATKRNSHPKRKDP